MIYYELYLIVTFLAVQVESINQTKVLITSDDQDKCSQYTNCRDCETLGKEDSCGWDGSTCRPEKNHDATDRCFRVLAYCLSNNTNEEEPEETSQSLVNVYLNGYSIDAQNESLETIFDSTVPCEIVTVQESQFQCRFKRNSVVRGDSIEVKIFNRHNQTTEPIVARRSRREERYMMENQVTVTGHIPGHRYNSHPGKIGIIGSGFTGINLSKEMIFCLAGIKCTMPTAVNDTFITCLFPAYVNNNVGPNFIGVRFPKYLNGSYCRNFNIMNDPTISRPAEKDTLNSAKRVINFTGEYLRSFWEAKIVIYMADGQRTPFESCEIKSDQSMLCPTPDISKFYPKLTQDCTFKVNFSSHDVDVTGFAVKYEENRELFYRRDPTIESFKITGSELEAQADLPNFLIARVSIRSLDSVNETIRCSRPSYSGIRMTCTLNSEPDANRKWRLILQYGNKFVYKDPTDNNEDKPPWAILVPAIIGLGFLVIITTVVIVFIRARNKPKRTVNINPFTGELDVDADTFTGYTLYSPRTQFTKTTTSSGKKSKSGRSYGSGKGSSGNKPK